MYATKPRIDGSTRFLVSTLDHLWAAKGWETGRACAPHERTLVAPALWLRPAGRDDVALFVHMHGPTEVEQARTDVALTAASAVDGAPRWVGCVQVFDVRAGGEDLGQVARLGHAMACELGSFVYHASTWHCADQVVDLARAVENTAGRLCAMAGIR